MTRAGSGWTPYVVLRVRVRDVARTGLGSRLWALGAAHQDLAVVGAVLEVLLLPAAGLVAPGRWARKLGVHQGHRLQVQYHVQRAPVRQLQLQLRQRQGGTRFRQDITDTIAPYRISSALTRNRSETLALAPACQNEERTKESRQRRMEQVFANRAPSALLAGSLNPCISWGGQV